MATLQPLCTPSRQPFGVLSDTKLRNLQSMKNKQNALAPNSAPSLKRRAPSPELSDSENVDPNILDSFGKRKRAAFDDDVSLSKPSRYSIQIIPASKPRAHAPTATTPRLNTITKPASAPLSAPAAAGRSPTRGKRLGLLKPSKRFAPPTFGTKSPSLSITAALKGTLAHKRAKKARTIEESKPKTWFFDIFEESDEQQNYRMNEWTMTQSAVILDISDDESKAKEKSDRGKENVDPNEASAPVTRSMTASAKPSAARASRKEVVDDEPRTPLGDLNPAEFYAEGLDATSVVLVHDDVEVPEEQPSQQPIVDTPGKVDFTFEAEASMPHTSLPPVDTSEIGALIAASVPVWIDTPMENDTPETKDPIPMADSVIDIWESESAKDENETVDVKFEDNGVFTLQEL